MKKKMGNSPKEQMNFERKRFKERLKEKPIDYEKQKELIKLGVQKQL